jgi:Protein of unknown function (DUF3000)
MSSAGQGAPRLARPGSGPGSDVPEIFRRAVAGIAAERERQNALRPELEFEDEPAPKRLAAHAAALAATVYAAPATGVEIASGRLILLYDPAGHPGWAGPFRVVAQIRAELDPEVTADPLLGPVGWSWLTEALDARTAGYAAPSGTVTRVITEGFGAKEAEPAATEFELRASWSPAASGAGTGPPDLAGHVAAWCDAMCAAVGLPPPEVTALRPAGKNADQRNLDGLDGHRDGHPDAHHDGHRDGYRDGYREAHRGGYRDGGSTRGGETSGRGTQPGSVR